MIFNKEKIRLIKDHGELNNEDEIYSKKLLETYNEQQDRLKSLDEEKTYPLGYGQYELDNLTITQKVNDNPFKKLDNKKNIKSSSSSSPQINETNLNNVDDDDEDKIKKFFESS